MKVLNTLKWMVLIGLQVILLSSCEEKQEYVAVTGVELTPKDTVIGLDETVALTVKVLPENATNRTYRMLLNETDVVSLDEATNVATGLKAGTAHITVVTEDGGKTAAAKIKVVEPEPEVFTFNLETLDVTYSDIVVRVNASNENARYWMWCAERSEVGNLTEDELIAYDNRTIDMLRDLYQEETGEVPALEDILEAFTYTGSQDRSMSALLGEDLQPETEYVVWAYGIELDGKMTSDIFSVSETTLEDPNTPPDGPGNGGDGPGNGEDDPGKDDPEPPVFQEIEFSNTDFTVVVTNMTTSSITMDVTPVATETPYFAFYVRASEFEPGGWFAGCSDGQIVSELFFAEWYYDDLFDNQYTGVTTVEFTKNIKADTEYTILLFRGIGVLDGKLLKHNVTTPAE